MPNTALLQETMQFIIDNPEKHDQWAWARKAECGTAACFAGWACILSGYEIDISLGKHYAHALKDGGDIGGTARHLLKLTERQSDKLFSEYNTVSMLQLMVQDLIDGKGLRRSLESYEKKGNDDNCR